MLYICSSVLYIWKMPTVRVRGWMRSRAVCSQAAVHRGRLVAWRLCQLWCAVGGCCLTLWALVAASCTPEMRMPLGSQLQIDQDY